ncbi:MAG: phosphate acyltransferase PlsX [Armatimonadetes bacterium]|nr:phosphate acyltransferase PlsX [Armatimonadota bacterium]
MRIAVDAMGGDYAPAEIVAGCLLAAQQFPDTELLLVGDETALRAQLPAALPANLVVWHAPDTIAMDEDPAKSVRRKPDSSLAVAARLVAQGEAEALFSAGNTGAVTAAAALLIGRLRGVDRPGIATVLPSRNGWAIVCDVGANVDCKAEWIVQFGVMAAIYAEEVEGIANPRVGLLNIGEESSKGDSRSKSAHELFQAAGLNWIGNVDAKDTFRGVTDVIACDGFAGNLLLKASEGAAEYFVDLMRAALTKNWQTKLGALLVKPGLRQMKRKIDYSEYGGAFLLGIKGLVVIGHGRSNAKAVASALRRTRMGLEHRLVQRLETRFSPPEASVAVG